MIWSFNTFKEFNIDENVLKWFNSQDNFKDEIKKLSVIISVTDTWWMKIFHIWYNYWNAFLTLFVKCSSLDAFVIKYYVVCSMKY